jgi:hypothetical protein
VIGSAVRYTKRCREQELRPDLLVDPITVTPNGNQDIYTTVIRNAGATAAGPFTVLFDDGAKKPPQQRVPRLAPYTSRSISFAGPQCDPAAPPTIIADQYSEVDDLNRANNSIAAVCPTAGTG